MRKIILPVFIFCFIATTTIQSQNLSVPRQSPHATISQTIGLSEITIDYHRPAVNNRTIWGNLVPYGLTTSQFGDGNPAPWRAGANENTVISLTHDAKVEGKLLPAGKYGLFMIPSENEWVIIFNKNSTSWGSFFYDEKDDVLSVTVKPRTADFQEWLSYGFDNITNSSVDAYLRWEKLEIPFAIEFDVHNIVLESFRKELKSLPGFSWQAWNQAAFYCLQNNINLDEAEEWSRRSISLQENENNRNILAYVLMAKNNIDGALKIYKENIDLYPNSWNVFDSLGEAYSTLGNTDEAIENFEKALDMAPENQKQRIKVILEGLRNN